MVTNYEKINIVINIKEDNCYRCEKCIFRYTPFCGTYCVINFLQQEAK